MYFCSRLHIYEFVCFQVNMTILNSNGKAINNNMASGFDDESFGKLLFQIYSSGIKYAIDTVKNNVKLTEDGVAIAFANDVNKIIEDVFKDGKVK